MNGPVLPLALTFLGVSIPTVLLLQHFELGGDFRLLIAMAAGALASSLVQAALRQRGDKP